MKYNYKTKKYIKKTIKKHTKRDNIVENIPFKISKYIQRSIKYSDISKLNKTNENIFSFNPNHNHNNKYINKYKIANGLLNIQEYSRNDKLFSLIKKYLPLDAEQYIQSINSTKQHTLKAYLYVNISDDYFTSYMLDRLILDKQDNLFPQVVPEFYPKQIKQQFHYIFGVLNQTFTILKDIAIILSKFVKRPANIKHCFNIIEVVLNLDTQNNITLQKCIIKREWTDSKFDNIIYEWLNDILLTPVLTNNKVLHSGLSTQLLYTTKNNITSNPDYLKSSINKIKNVDEMTLNDFKDVYIIFITEKESEREFRISNLENKLQKYNLHPIDPYSSLGMKVKFLWLYNVEYDLDLGQIRKHFNTIAYLANSLSLLDNIDNKFNLYNNMKRLFPNEYLDFMMESFPLRKDYQLKPDEIVVAKPLYVLELLKKNKKFLAAAGIDILFINDNKTLNTAKRLLYKYDTIMLSKYLRNPLLFQKRKFHFRLIFIIAIVNNTVKSYLLDTMRIITAKLPFKLTDFHNADIHDTHLKSTPQDLYFPADFTTENMGIVITPDIIDKLWIDIREIMRKITLVALDGNNHIRLYDRNKNGFHIFGPDIMISEDFKPILLECNSNPTFRRLDYTNHYLDKKLFDLLDYNVFSPAFTKELPKEYITTLKDEPLFIKKM